MSNTITVESPDPQITITIGEQTIVLSLAEAEILANQLAATIKKFKPKPETIWRNGSSRPPKKDDFIPLTPWNPPTIYPYEGPEPLKIWCSITK